MVFRCDNSEFVYLKSVTGILLLNWLPCGRCGRVASTRVFANDSNNRMKCLFSCYVANNVFHVGTFQATNALLNIKVHCKWDSMARTFTPLSTTSCQTI